MRERSRIDLTTPLLNIRACSRGGGTRTIRKTVSLVPPPCPHTVGGRKKGRESRYENNNRGSVGERDLRTHCACSCSFALARELPRCVPNSASVRSSELLNGTSPRLFSA